jgi:hypothetical protein
MPSMQDGIFTMDVGQRVSSLSDKIEKWCKDGVITSISTVERKVLKK